MANKEDVIKKDPSLEAAEAAGAPIDIDLSAPPSEDEVERLRRELSEETERRIRVLAESENLKKRLFKEKEEFVKYAVENLVSELLPVLDNLDLALLHGRGNEACKDLVMGVDMTRKVFLDILARHGIEEYGKQGEPFNPERHEAMGVEQDPQAEEDAVLRVMQKGYMMRDRLLRPAKVIVNKK